MHSPIKLSPIKGPPIKLSSTNRSPIKLSPIKVSPMFGCVSPPPSRLQPMCGTPHIQVPTNTPTIAGLTTSTKRAQSQLLQEAASKLEDRSLAEMGSKQTYLKA